MDVELAALASEGGGQVEPEAVDVHLAHPVPERVEDQPERRRVADVKAVAGPGGVEVVGAVPFDQAVVGRVVDAFHGKSRPQVIALRGVVVHDVEDDFQAGGVQRPDHGLELVHLAPGRAGGAVRPVRGQKTDAVVPPVIAQASLQEVGILDELVDRHQLDSRHPEVHQIRHYGRMGQPRVGAPQLRPAPQGGAA